MNKTHRKDSYGSMRCTSVYMQPAASATSAVGGDSGGGKVKAL